MKVSARWPSSFSISRFPWFSLAPVSLHPADLAVNDGDPLHISWILAWDAHQAVRDPLHLFDSNAFYPYPSSARVLGAPSRARRFWPLRSSTRRGTRSSPRTSTLVLTLALSAFAMYLLTREVFGSELGALVAGLVYTFHAYGFHEAPRLQLLSIQWWPLAALLPSPDVLPGPLPGCRTLGVLLHAPGSFLHLLPLLFRSRPSRLRFRVRDLHRARFHPRQRTLAIPFPSQGRSSRSSPSRT